MKLRNMLLVLGVVILLLALLLPSCGSKRPTSPPDEAPEETILSPSAQSLWDKLLRPLRPHDKNQPTPTPTQTPKPSPKPTPTPAPTLTPAPTPTPTSTPTPTPTFTATPTSTATLALSPHPEIVGTWSGGGVSHFMEGPGKRLDRITWNVTLVINGVSGNTAQGTLTMIDVKHESLQGGPTQPQQNYGPDPIANGQVGDTRLYFNVDDWRWEFTFTTDLMSGHFTSPIQGQCDPKAFTLTKLR